ncbi:VpsF family polysaccharide biosynthesis protein [Aquincola sp. MAHUQ-54]|uniref:VpsF family polysaccharide biosynthesis protein n=1 Tax=Aquincola agrisoli TaxID=3119538 RepID=A0AAW9QEB0_9BURK
MTPAPGVRWRRVAACLFGLGLAAYLGLSASSLFALGIPYDAPYGPMPAKIHPGTYLTLLALFIALCSHGNPLGVALRLLGQQPLVAVYLASVVYLLAYSVLRYGPSGAAFVIDTLIMAGLCLLTTMLFEARWQRRFLALIGFTLVANALLGLGEALAQARLVPLRLAGGPEMLDEYFRASALLGHPLMNAQTTASLLPVVLLLPAPRVLRYAMGLAMVLSLLAFGGRTSFAVALLMYGSYAVFRLVDALARGRLSYLQLTGGSVGLGLLMALTVGVVAGSGLGERIFNGLVWDNSASVRMRVWGVFDFMGADQILFGTSPDEMAKLMIRLGLDAPVEAIENFWLVLFIQFGVAGFVPFFIGFGCLLRWLWRRAFGALRVALLTFVVISSTTNSLASKTVGLSLLCCVVASAASLRPRPSVQHLPFTSLRTNP